MTSYDYSKFPQGTNQRRDFVLSLLGQSELRESDFIEVKSEFDLMDRQHQIKVAKFILAAANRDPNTASRHLGGYAVLVAGLGREDVIGIQGEELIDLNKEVLKFIGAPGDAPEWFIERVEFEDSKTVLMVFVAPPTGSIYPSLASTGKALESGRVYIRNQGQTKEISGPQLRAKVRKLEANSNPELQISVNQLGHVVELKPRFGSARELVMGLVTKLREDAPAIVEKSDDPKDIASMLNIQFAGALPSSKDYYGRTPEKFHADLDLAKKYEDDDLEDLALAIGAKCTPPISLEIELASTIHAEEIELTVSLPEAVFILDEVTEEEVHELADEFVPEPWTDPLRGRYDLSAIHRPDPILQGLRHVQSPTSVTKINDHKCIIYLKEVRFGEPRRFSFSDYRLVKYPGTEGPVIAEWTLTARNYAGQVSGTIELS